MISLRVRMTLVLLAGLALAGCSHPSAAKTPDPESMLQAIPPADSAQYEHMQDMKKWRNPYLIIRADGVALYDSADSAEIMLKPEELLTALAKLPASNWPYGRVVAATEEGESISEENAVAVRRNKGIVGGMLEDAHIDVKWVPSV